MKIIILANSSKGLFDFRQELIAELVKKNTVCAYTPDNGSVSAIKALGCEFFELPVDRRVMKAKGIDELFEVMRRLTVNGINCSLNLLGGYEEEEIIEKYKAEGWLNYHGYQLDVHL